MESFKIFKSKSYGAEIKTVYSGMVAMLKSSVGLHQSVAASAVAFRDEMTLLIASEYKAQMLQCHTSAQASKG